MQRCGRWNSRFLAIYFYDLFNEDSKDSTRLPNLLFSSSLFFMSFFVDSLDSFGDSEVFSSFFSEDSLETCLLVFLEDSVDSED